jgi:hypothetical protein
MKSEKQLVAWRSNSGKKWNAKAALAISLAFEKSSKAHKDPNKQ